MAPAQSRQLSAFMHVSLDGYFCDPRGDMFGNGSVVLSYAPVR